MGAAPILSILKDGETIKSCPIEGEAWIGRAEGCVIRLEDRAVSRQHAVLKPVKGGVQVQKRSEFGQLQVNGAECTQAIVKEGDVILIGPYLMRVSVPREEAVQFAQASVVAQPAETPFGEIHGEAPVSDPSLEPAPEEASAGSSTENAFPESVEASQEPPGVAGFSEPEAEGAAAASSLEFAEDDARTKITAPEKLAIKLVFKPGQANHTEFDFVQEEISIGRGKSCDIVLNDKKASRKNAIIRRAGLAFSIKDLGSANGTYVNGVRIDEQELTGDELIRIGDVEFEFKAMSSDYLSQQNDFMAVEAEVSPEDPFGQPLAGNDQFNYASPLAVEAQSAPAVSEQPQPGFEVPGAGAEGLTGIAGIGKSSAPQSNSLLGKYLQKFREMPKQRQYIYIVLIVGALYLFLFDEEPKQVAKQSAKKPTVAASGTPVKAATFDSLPPEKKKFVEAQHALAFDYYKNKEYDKALFEVNKIFTLVNDYKDAREIERYAKEGKRKREAIEEEKRRKEEEARLKARVIQLEDEVRDLMARKLYEQARERFTEITILDPDNQAVAKWRQQLEEIEENKRLVEQQKAVQAEVNRQAWTIYREGVARYNQQKYQIAIGVFARVKEIGASDSKLLSQTNAMIAKSRAELKGLRDPILAEAKEAEAAGEHVKAYQLFRKATQIDTMHPEGYAGMNRIKGFLHERAKALYTEAVLAESYSDFVMAKRKFQECLTTAPRDDVYYERAQRKLARYFKKDDSNL